MGVANMQADLFIPPRLRCVGVHDRASQKRLITTPSLLEFQSPDFTHRVMMSGHDEPIAEGSF